MLPLSHVRITLLLIALLCSLGLTPLTRTATAQSQELIFERTPVAANPLTIVQDHQGYMWFGTYTGLVRYDGYQSSFFPSDDRVESLYVDRQGVLWVGTMGGGLNRFDAVTETFTRFQHDPDEPSSLASDLVFGILEDREGDLWIATESGLDRMDRATGTFTHFRHDPNDATSLSHNQTRVLYEDREGTLWIGTDDRFSLEKRQFCCGLNRFDPETETFTRYLPNPDNPRRLADGRIWAILEDSRGLFWVGTSGEEGLYTLDRATGDFTRHRNDPENPGNPSQPQLVKGTSNSGSNTSFIYEDQEGMLWIGGTGEGINRFDPETGTQTHYEADSANPDDPRSLPSNHVWRIYEARDGTLWITSWTENGLFKVTQQTALPHYLLDPAGPAAVNQVNAFYEDREGILWVGTGGGLFRYDRATRTVLNSYLPEIEVEAIYEDSQGMFWIGTWGEGLFRFDPETESFTPYAHRPGDETSLGDDRVWIIYEDSQGTFWIGTRIGLYRMDRQRGTFERLFDDLNDQASLPIIIVRSLLEDREGQFWIAADGSEDTGLFRFDRKKGTHAKLIGSHFIPTIYEDRKGRFWVGTTLGGLLRFDRETGTHTAFTTRNSNLPHNLVTGIVEDEAGHLWLSTGGGLAQFDPEAETFRTYPGQKAEPFNWRVLYRSPRGEVFVGGQNGFHAFFPEALTGQEVEASSYPPDVALTGFRLFDETVRPSPEAPLNAPIWDAEVITLAHDQNVFSFNFAGFHYRDPSQNQHQYMLEGYDDDWREARGELAETYVKVPSGEYVFRVRAMSSDGVWNQEGASVRVMILPPWWKTWWAYALYALALAGAVVGAYRVQRARLLRTAAAEQVRLRAEAAESQARTMEAEHERDQIELEKAQEVETAYHDLEQAHEQLKTTQAQLVQSEKLASLGQLTSGIAHELKNPLNFVNNFAEVNEELTDELLEDIQARPDLRAADIQNMVVSLKVNAGHIAKHGKRADRIVKNMMEHAHDASGERYDVGVNKLVEEYTRLAYHTMLAKMPGLDVKIERHLDASVGSIEMAPQELGRALLAILNNALDAVHKKALASDGDYKPTVEVTTRQVHGQVEIRVCDNGPGIPTDIRDHIFEPFFTTKPTGTGTGLGLSLAYDIVTQGHGGALTVESKEGEGATFVLTLPRETS